MAQTATSKPAARQIKPAVLRRFHITLQRWYTTHGRHHLPWRQTDDPYKIWLSEVMLQQTQVTTVLARFYHPFLDKFPNVEALAAAPREAVMKAWEGLGYYSRARNLHDAAKAVTGNTSVTTRCQLPATIEELQALPGIGRNTASAIAAFAYHHPVAILEANVKRVVARIFAMDTPGDADLWQGAENLLNRDRPFDYNQAMMDLGSMVCTPKAPNCPACPANSICRGKTEPERYPIRKAKKHTPTREVIITVREDQNRRYSLEPRDARLLGGLYGFPQSAYDPGEKYIGTVTHVYSHFKLIAHVRHERVTHRTNSPDWHSRAEIAALPLSKLDHKVLALVENCHSGQKKAAKPHRRTPAH